MAATPPGPPPRWQPAENRGGDEDRGDAPGERYGPVDVDRRVKDDGRALILYSRILGEDRRAS